MNKPEYASDLVYQEVARLCEAAGYIIEYTDKVSDDAYAQTAEYCEIHMPIDKRIETPQKAAMTLGHELGHHLLWDVFISTPNNNSELNPQMHRLIEAQCDNFGAMLFSLAEKIAIHKAESVWQD